MDTCRYESFGVPIESHDLVVPQASKTTAELEI